MPCFKNCCCCVKLETGGLMMGIMTLSMSVFSMIPMAISLINRNFLAKVTVHILNRYGRGANATNPFIDSDFWSTVTNMAGDDEVASELPPDDDPQVERLRSAMLVFFIVCIILLVLYFLTSIMLMYGSVKGKRWFLLPWVVATLLFIIAYIVGMCLSTVLFGVSIISLIFLIIAITESVIAFYLWLCVISLFQHFGNPNNSKQGQGQGYKNGAGKYREIPQHD
eukprot:TRINITY_DN16405_c0_g1_i2.p1 TRINITY_DN16405_c0_g1~~TRINITY_DN16405_c0_g1_i2.p1  ORF type:complete len:224 (+),score=49.08 TRINITY_DN16405_c0_g1_i2:28-699(+)